MNPMSTGFKPMELLQNAKSDLARRVDLVVLGPFLDKFGRYWDHVEPRRTTFIDLHIAAPMVDECDSMPTFATHRGESCDWAQSCEILDIG